MGINRRDRLSQLPFEIHLLIFQNLDILNFPRFKVVCKAWRSIASAARQSALFRLQQIPWLLLLSSSSSSEQQKLIPKLSHNKMFYEFSVHDSSCICGSSQGWLLLSTSFNNGGDNFLLNPLTRQRISLPRNPSNSSILEKGVILLPQSGGDGISVVAHFRDGRFYQWRSRDEHWTMILGHHGGSTISDMIYHKGNIFAVNMMTMISVYIINISSRKPDCCLRARSPFVAYTTPRFINLVECDGDLLTVVRTSEKEETEEVGVFKYNPIMEWWEKVTSIGEKYGLLVGEGNSMTIDVSTTNSSFRGNCVYFLEYDDNLGQGIQCFDLRKNRFGIFVPYSWDAKATPPTWFMPKDPEEKKQIDENVLVL